jgi:SMODS-associating 4TM effector domain
VSHPTPPNNINDRQNEPWNIRLLAAQRQLYGEAKWWRRWRWVIVLGVAATGLLASAFYEPAGRWLGAVGGALLLVDWLVASPLETRRTKAAANIQEQFDTTVFGLPWKPIATGEKLDREEVIRAQSRYRPAKDDLIDWYPDVRGLPAPEGIIICQRTNLHWDMSLRQSYALAVWSGVGLLPLIALLLRLPGGLTWSEFFLAYLPLVAALRTGVTVGWSHRQHAQEQERLKRRLESAWQANLQGGQALTLETCRDLQDAIYRLRTIAPPVPDWWQGRHRERHQNEMHEVAALMRQDVISAGLV